LDDLAACVRLADAIPEILIACPVCLPADVPQQVQMANAICVLLENSSKMTQAAPHDEAEAHFWTEAAAIADQDLPADAGRSLMFVVSPTSPLQIDPNTCQVLKHGVDHNIPLLISPCPMAGATSPITMAGTTVQTHAEFLGMLTVSQLLRAGMPAIYGGSAGPMDLRIGALSYGAPERNTMLCANIDIANYFDLPHFSSAGTVDSGYPDFQAGQSKALTWLTRLMKGTTLGIWFGSLLTGSTVAPEQIVLDADLYRAVLSMLRGMSLDEAHLAYQAIQRVGPGGNFLLDEHTLFWMRSDEYYASPIVNHEGETGKDMLDRAHEQVQTILASHTSSVSEKVAIDLRRLLREYERNRAE
jgi:trimethylamine--corrinoid protein Co-methyltransferase